MSADLVAHCLANLPRHIPDAFERAKQAPQRERNTAAIDAIRAARIAEGGVL